MVVDELDALKNGDAACEMIAFADLSTKMILVTDSAASRPREVLDALCHEAATLLGGRNAPILGTKPVNSAIWATQSSVRVFLRAPGEPNDVLCCICAPNVNVGKFVARAAQCLDRISNG